MKLRHFKRRARHPDIRVTLHCGTKLVEVRSYAVMDRFFGRTGGDDERAARFFGLRQEPQIQQSP